MLEGVPARVPIWFARSAGTIVPVNIILDYASGHSLGRAIDANVGGFGAGYAISAATDTLIQHLVKVRFAARAAMGARTAAAGARVGNVAGALIGFIAGFAAYDFVAGIMLKMPDSSDRAHRAYDDFFSYP